MIEPIATLAKTKALTKARWTAGEVLHHRIPSLQDLERRGTNRSKEKRSHPAGPPTRPKPALLNPVLTAADVTDYGWVEGVADPFLVVDDGDWHLFFEVYNSTRDPTAVIGHAVSRTNGDTWEYDRVVLETDLHLSFPYVFEAAGERYMLPDTWSKSSDPAPIRLYRCEQFPGVWQEVATLVDPQIHIHDCVVFERRGRWWALAGDGSDLYAYHSNSLEAEGWTPHRSNPVVEGRPTAARPAGRPYVADDKLVVYLQDCNEMYGKNVRAYNVTELSVDSYLDKELDYSPIVEAKGGKLGWNSGKMHHIDYHAVDGRWRCVVDGNIDAGRMIFGNNWSIGVYDCLPVTESSSHEEEYSE